MKPHQNSTKQHQRAHQNDSQPTETAIIDRLRTCRAVTGTPGTAQERREPAEHRTKHDTPPALANPRTIGSRSRNNQTHQTTAAARTTARTGNHSNHAHGTMVAKQSQNKRHINAINQLNRARYAIDLYQGKNPIESQIGQLGGIVCDHHRKSYKPPLLDEMRLNKA